MTRKEIREVIQEFLDLIERGSSSVETNEAALNLVLDKLALALHYVEYSFDDTTYPEAPRRDQSALRELIEMRFPNYRLYNTPEFTTSRIEASPMMVGDAIDDILDIANDLYEVAWCWENTSGDDALWHLQENYQSHWRLHLRGLQRYLQELDWE